MTLQELQKQVLKLSVRDRWQLVQFLLNSLRQNSYPAQKKNLSRLRGVAKRSESLGDEDTADYINYLMQKYQ